MPLDINGLHWIFADPAVTEDDLKNIRPFNQEYASKYWSDNIYSENHLQRNTQTVVNDNWICSLKEAKYNWHVDWNDNNCRGLPEFLSNCVDLPEDELIVFFWSQSDGLETTWGIFLRNWINFLYEDESPILICLRTGFSIIFGPTGTLYWGYKVNCR